MGPTLKERRFRNCSSLRDRDSPSELARGTARALWNRRLLLAAGHFQVKDRRAVTGDDNRAAVARELPDRYVVGTGAHPPQ